MNSSEVGPKIKILCLHRHNHTEKDQQSAGSDCELCECTLHSNTYTYAQASNMLAKTCKQDKHRTQWAVIWVLSSLIAIGLIQLYGN